jgi:Ca2+:H+ antiporter
MTRWFGLVLLPLISFSGDGVITFGYAFQNMFFNHGKKPHALADAQPIDLSIQFALFWTPVLILVGWMIGKPLPLMFGTSYIQIRYPVGFVSHYCTDIFEVAILVAACFVVNYVTADAKSMPLARSFVQVLINLFPSQLGRRIHYDFALCHYRE